MPDRVRVGIVGAGIGQEHLQAYRQLGEHFQVVEVCDLDLARAESAIAEVGARGTVAGADPEALIARGDVDVVDVCLPPHLHVAWSLKALEAGKHVICEKPIATSLADLDRLEAAVIETGRQVFPVFQYRFGPETAKLRAMMAAGLTGRPLVASVETHWRRDAAYYDNPWRGTWKGEQGGAVLGHAIHAHDLLCAIFGPVDKVSAMLATRANPIETEDCAALAFRMANGALATSSVTLGAADDTSRMRFVFEKMTVESDRAPYAPGCGTWTFQARGGAAEQAEIDAVTSAEAVGFVGFLTAVSRALEGDTSDGVTLADGRRSIELVTAIYHAARRGEVVSLPLRDHHPLYGGWQPEERT